MSERPTVLAPLLKLQREVADFIFPPRCVGCRTRGQWFCAACRNAASRVPSSICKQCGAPTPELHTCSRCWKTPPRFDALRARYFFEGTVRQAIHLFKYRRSRHMVGPLAELLLESIEPDFAKSDAVVPVPLHERRLRERSYNQSQLLASEVSQALGIVLVDNSLVRLRDTKPQMRLPAEDRSQNVRDAFGTIDHSLAGKKVLLIDDVCTTGATLSECASALKKTGVATVWAACVARAR